VDHLDSADNFAIATRQYRAPEIRRSDLADDVVVASHGGVARVLAVLFGVRPPADATHGDVVQGVVYEFTQGTMTRHD
jgi:broad specificity phosphatase PhoE